MTDLWHVWSDGSCKWPGVNGAVTPQRRTPGHGGWCAIIEHGHDGQVLRGRMADTTNVQMELHAATEGLRATPAGAHVLLHVDCNTVLLVDEWRLAAAPMPVGRDGRWRTALARELGLRTVTIDVIVKGRIDLVHRRCDKFAGAEASAGLRGLPGNAIPLDDGHRLRKGTRRAAVRDLNRKPTLADLMLEEITYRRNPA